MRLRHDLGKEIWLDARKTEHHFGDGGDLARFNVEHHEMQAALFAHIGVQRFKPLCAKAVATCARSASVS